MRARAGALRTAGAATRLAARPWILAARLGVLAARAGVLMTALATVLAGGCGHLTPRWPWHHPPAAPVAPVHELDISDASGNASAAVTFPQYWKRNTLVVDLSAVSGSGHMTLRPATENGWPVRLALRVTPGSIGELDVRGAERLVVPVTAEGAGPVDIELAPGVYSGSTRELTVSWGPPEAANLER